MSAAPNAEQVTVIAPHGAWWRLSLQPIWEYRDLLILLVRRDFLSRYRQTILGPAWFILQPLLMTLVFTVLFGKVARLPTAGAPPVLFYLAGQLFWTYPAQLFQTVSGTFTSQAGLFGKVYFPRLVVPCGAALSGLMGLFLQAVTYAAFWIFFKMRGAPLELDWTILWLPLAVAQITLIGLGTGLIMAALTAKYRDLSHLVPFLAQIWMYASPVIYPVSFFPEKWRWAAELNPMTFPIECLRSITLQAGDPDAGMGCISLTVTVALLLTGILSFQRVERTFVDTV